MKTASTFSEAVAAFEESAPWLGTVDLPALVALRALADELDGGAIQAAMVAQFGLVYRALLKRAPDADSEAGDPLAQALAAAHG